LGGSQIDGAEYEVIAVETADGKHASNDENLQSATMETLWQYHDEQEQRVRDEGINREHGNEDSTIISTIPKMETVLIGSIVAQVVSHSLIVNPIFSD